MQSPSEILFKRLVIALLVKRYEPMRERARAYAKARSKRLREQDPEKYRSEAYRWRKEHPEQWKAIVKRTLLKNREPVLAKKKIDWEVRGRDARRKNLGQQPRVFKSIEQKTAERAAIEARKSERAARVAQARERRAERRKAYQQRTRYTRLERERARRAARTPEKIAADRARATTLAVARRARDPVARMMHSFRCRLSIFVTRPYRTSGMNELIGCNGDELRAHIEKLWLAGMSWANYGRGEGKWVIDHRHPIAAFDLFDEAELHQCWHYSNLQPMWWRDNLIKNAKFPEQSALVVGSGLGVAP